MMGVPLKSFRIFRFRVCGLESLFREGGGGVLKIGPPYKPQGDIESTRDYGLSLQRCPCGSHTYTKGPR